MMWLLERNGAPATVLSKILMSVAVVGMASAVSGLGTFGAFTSNTSVDDVPTPGPVQVRLGANGTATDRIPLILSGVGPGHAVEQAATLTRTADQDLGRITLTTSTTDPSALTTDTRHGLRLSVDACSEPWIENGGTRAYTCPGAVTVVVHDRPVIGEGIPLPGLPSTTTSGADELRLVVRLPATADTTFQDLTSTVSFTFTAVHRASPHR